MHREKVNHGRKLKRRILYIQYTKPANYPPLEHSSRILLEDGWEVLFLGTGSRSGSKMCFPPHERMTVRELGYYPPGWRQKVHYLWFCLWALFWTLRWRPRWIYASQPLACPAAWLLSLVPGTRLVYHEHDSPSLTGNGWAERLWMWARKRCVRRAVLCIIPNHERLERFVADLDAREKAICVWNCPKTSEAEQPPRHKTDGVFRLFYHGSIVPSQLPPTLLEAMAQLPGHVVLRIAGYETIGHEGYVAELMQQSEALGIRDRFEYVGTIPERSALLDLCREADVGLALFAKSTPQPMAGASNKPFDYMACNLALLVAMLPDWEEMFVRPGYAIACNPDDVSSIVRALKWLMDHPAERAAMGAAGRRRIATEWNYAAQFEPVREFLNGGPYPVPSRCEQPPLMADGLITKPIQPLSDQAMLTQPSDERHS